MKKKKIILSVGISLTVLVVTFIIIHSLGKKNIINNRVAGVD